MVERVFNTWLPIEQFDPSKIELCGILPVNTLLFWAQDDEGVFPEGRAWMIHSIEPNFRGSLKVVTEYEHLYGSIVLQPTMYMELENPKTSESSVPSYPIPRIGKDKETYFTISQICTKLKISRATLERLRKQVSVNGGPPFPKPSFSLGRYPRWAASVLNEWIISQNR